MALFTTTRRCLLPAVTAGAGAPPVLVVPVPVVGVLLAPPMSSFKALASSCASALRTG